MTTLPTVLISGASEELTSRIEQLIRSQAELSFVSSVTPDQVSSSEDLKAKLIWIELESDPLGNLAVLEALIKSNPNTFFVVSKEDLEPDLVKRAMQIGALDFLDHKGWAAQIRSVIRRVMAKEYGSKPQTNSAGRATPGSNWNQLNNLKIQTSSSTFRRVDATKSSVSRQPSESERELAFSQYEDEPVRESLQEVVTDTYTTEEIQESQEYSEGEQAQEYAEGYSEEEVQYYYTEDGQLLYYTEDGQAYTEDGQAYAGLVYSQDGQVWGPDGQLLSGEEYNQEETYVAEDAQSEIVPEVWQETTGDGSEQETDSPEGYSELPLGYTEDEQGYTTDGPAEEIPSQEEYEGSYGEESALGLSGEFKAHHLRQLEESGKFPAATLTDAPLEEPLLPPEPDGDTAGGTIDEPPEKARWGELDSIISTPKSEGKKAGNKWADLDSIATKQKSEKEATSKWGELDALSKPASTAKTTEPTSKWGDLDAIAASGQTQEDTGSTWTESEEIGSEVSVDIGIQSSSNWSELGEITASSGAIGSTANQWGDLDSISTVEPSESKAAGKWGELDAIGSKSAKTSFPKGEAPEGAQRKASGKWGELDSIHAKSPGNDPQPAVVNKFTRKTQNVELPKIPDAEPTADKESGPTDAKKWGNLDEIASPRKVLGPEESKWGNLDSIPTPGKKVQEPTAAWAGDLDTIPTPKAGSGPVTGPALVEGALPIGQAQSTEASKWKMGMSTDMSSGAREVGAMRDKLKDSITPVKISWGKLHWVVAAVVLASQLYLVFSFCNYPTPPAEISMGR